VVETKMRQRDLLLLQKQISGKGTDHGPHRAYCPGWEKHEKQRGSLL
jgi:hypothetical protein